MEPLTIPCVVCKEPATVLPTDEGEFSSFVEVVPSCACEELECMNKEIYLGMMARAGEIAYLADDRPRVGDTYDHSEEFGA